MAVGLLALCCPVSIEEQELPTEAVIPVQNAHSYIRQEAQGHISLALMIENMTCAACLPHIEETIKTLSGIQTVLVSLSTKRLFIVWDPQVLDADEIMCALAEKGYLAHPFDGALLDHLDQEGHRLLKCLGVAGFAAVNIMLLSISIWAGLAEDMDTSTRTLFYWISAVIALPSVAWAGQPFFEGAIRSLKAGRLSMDVPIALAVILSLTVSVIATWQQQPHAYFDAGITLLFFLLIGRYLDHRMRAKARTFAENLLLLQSRPAIRVNADGDMTFVKSDDLKENDLILVRIGDRIMADGIVYEGNANLDNSFLTGESHPSFVKEGHIVHAGTIVLDAPLLVKVQKAGRHTLLAEIVRVMEDSQQNRSQYMHLSDRVSRWYAPVVHILAVLTFAGWLIQGAPLITALMYATAVLIITCPCALALAVPVVQVVATGRLLKNGIFIKGGDVLERIASITDIYFDKTGTLTKGKLVLLNRRGLTDKTLALAAALSQGSRHPIAQCLTEHARKEGLKLPDITDHQEIHGFGGQGWHNGVLVQLGRAEWLGLSVTSEQMTSTWLRDEKGHVTSLRFVDELRDDAGELVDKLRYEGYRMAILSGDHRSVVEAIGAQLSIHDIHGGLTPVQKVKFIQQAIKDKKFPLMVGDGLNDAPALLAAKASISHACASDLAQNAADVVFVGSHLAPIAKILHIAKQAYMRMIQNIVLSLCYNILAVPLAIGGYITPLWASVAMSTSSLFVIVNALRIHNDGQYSKWATHHIRRLSRYRQKD